MATLDKPTHMYDALSKRRYGPVKAVIAARYENVVQAFNKLCLKFAPFALLKSKMEAQSLQVDDTLARLTIWGHETGAGDQTLDYKLRKSKEMHDMVDEMLQVVQTSLEEATQLLEDHRLQDWASRAGDDPAGGSASPPMVVEHRDEGDCPCADPARLDDAASALGSDPETAELLDNLFEHFAELEECVNNLIMLGPSLEHPYPQDIDAISSGMSNTSEPSDQLDIERAKNEFPSASRILQTRLGHANWKRRIAQTLVSEQIHRDGKIHASKVHGMGVKKTHHHDVAQDAFNFQKPTLKPQQKAPPQLQKAPQQQQKTPDPALRATRPFLPLLSAAASSAAQSDTTSLFDVDHHAGAKLARAESATTLATLATFDSKKFRAAGAGGRMLPQQPLPVKEAVFPKPPVALADLAKGKTQWFTCSFCGYDLEAGSKIKTEEDWTRHLFEDLEPYLCTFDKCFSAQETYGRLDEWYRHELESHRIKKTWACPACMHEFETKAAATEHLVQVHCQEVEDEQEVAMMKAMLRQTLSGQHLGTQICPLCGDKVAASACKEHIGRHLEYFALLSLAGDDASEEDDSDEIFSQSDDALSERGRKELVLNTFVTEQFKLNLERSQQPPDGFLEGSGALDLLDDMSDYDGSKDSESRGGGDGGGGGGGGGRGRGLLMERMLRADSNSGSAGAAGAEASGARTRQGGGGGGGGGSWAAGPPSTTTTERLPLLRTLSLPQNPDFMGRDKELASLYKILSEPGRVCVVSGEGGMGKTALAVEYTWRFEQSYHYIFWVQAETPVGSSDTFSQIAQQLHLAPDGTDPDTMIRLGREFLEQVRDKRWLMVLDNVEHWEDIDVYTPTKTSATQGSILITTRHESLTAPSRPVNYFRVALQELGVDEGRQLLIHRLPEEMRPVENSLRDPEYKVAGEIAGLVGVPLLIVYISGYIKKAGCSLSEFWEYWNEWRVNARLGAGAGAGGGAAAAAALAKGEDDDQLGERVLHMTIRDLSQDERELLKIMAFFDSNGIQREALEWNYAVQPGPSYLRRNRLRVIMNRLKAHSIVSERKEMGREMYVVHRLLQAKLLSDMNANREERDRIFGLAFALIRNRLPRPSLETPEQAEWNAFKEYLPHVLSLQRAYADPLSTVTVKPFLGLAELFKDGGVLLWQRYIHEDALKLLRSAERVLAQLPPPAPAAAAAAAAAAEEEEEEEEREGLQAEINITVNLLLQYFGINYRKEIMERSHWILTYRERQLAQKQAPAAATRAERLVLNDARADYANTLLQFNDYEKAEPMYEACLAAYLEGGDDGSDPGATAFAVAKLNHHLAYCKMYRRQFGEALALSGQAVGIIEGVSDMAMALRYRFDYACILLQSGQREAALAMHREILQARLGFQGRASYFTLQSQYAVAALCHYLGRLEEAESLMKSTLGKAASRGGKNFWPEAAVARTKYHLSLVMLEREEAAAAATAATAAEAGGPEATAEGARRREEARRLAIEAKDVLSRMLPYDPDPITGVREEDTLALFDHLQPVFGGRFTGTKLLGYVARRGGK